MSYSHAIDAMNGDMPIKEHWYRCDITGELISGAWPHFHFNEGRLHISIAAVVEMFEQTLTTNFYHGAPAEWVLLDLLERFGSRKRRRVLSKAIAKKVLNKYNFSCVKCGSKERLQVDHIVPVKKGGKDEIGNLQILCQPCNLRKGVRSNDQFMEHG